MINSSIPSKLQYLQIGFCKCNSVQKCIREQINTSQRVRSSYLFSYSDTNHQTDRLINIMKKFVDRCSVSSLVKDKDVENNCPKPSLCQEHSQNDPHTQTKSVKENGKLQKHSRKKNTLHPLSLIMTDRVFTELTNFFFT